MLVKEVMSTQVAVVAESSRVDDALRLLVERRVTSLPVVADDGAVIGILSEADLLDHLLSRDPRAHQIPVAASHSEPPRFVRDLMTTSVHVTRPDEDVSDLAELMLRHGWKSVPVVERGRLVGMVSRSDVVRALARPEAWIRHEIQAVLSELGHSTWEVDVESGVATVTGPATPAERVAAQAAILSVPGVRQVRAVEAQVQS
jgi:CBS domain-containing protein